MSKLHLRKSTLVPRLPAQLWLLAVAAFVNFLGFMVTPFLVLYLTQVTAFSVEIAGVLLTCFGIGGILGAWSGGRLSDRIGSRNVLFLSFLVSAVAMFIIPLISNVLLIGAMLIILAFANGAFRPAYDACVVRLCPESERSHAYAVYVVAINVGAGIAAGLGGKLYAIEPHLIFYADGLTSIVAAGLVFVFLDQRANHSQPAAKKQVAQNGQASAPYTSVTFLIVCLASCVLDVVSKQTSVTLPIYVSSVYGMDAAAFGSLLTIGYITFAAAVLPVTAWVKTQNQLRTAVVGMGIVSSAFFLISVASSMGALVALYLLITIGQLLFYPAIMAVAMGEAAKDAQRSGEYMGFYRTVQSAAGIAAPSIGTFIYTQVSPAALWFFCAILVVGSATALWGQNRRGQA
ncbi:MFS transporter [Rhizobium sp. WYJ-E13]|uniref:MFS transporter n=1 Tax=Rhizobium sp. WYJ-E13 TaxID=2849093 RepID=UPI001C1E94A0|nr:MFS transporter [Rhizobium sp. WYJ-E13]QWW71077.1 MFS transporter [Rhizobium sp. WYJ-E13]